MPKSAYPFDLTRRQLLGGAAAGMAVGLLAPLAPARGAERRYTLRAAPARAHLLGATNPATDVWAYSGRVPGPVIRARQGDRLHVRVENALAQPTTVHWHGLRVPNAMDGVPGLTQPPIAPGAGFDYVFDLPDAGTYWYHPHTSSPEQVGRGLAGALIVDEPDPPRVDRDLLWLIDDWRLREDASISPDFGGFMDASHAGRLGNIVTINGRAPEDLLVRAGERLRLRLVNVANARIFALDFGALAPLVLTLDGQPVSPHAPVGGRITLGPGQRADVILDMTGKPGDAVDLRDDFYPRSAYRLLSFKYGPEPLRAQPLPPPAPPAPNRLAEPAVARAKRQAILFEGGMMGRMGGGMMGMMSGGAAWTVNGVAGTGHALPPVVSLRRGETGLLALANDTAWWHPIHLHGHFFRVLSRNGVAQPNREWLDSVLLAPRERVDIAFVADNPGDWMFHCHILEHQSAGMQAIVRVA